MTSGMTTFNAYLAYAWPLFAVTMAVVLVFHALRHRRLTRHKTRFEHRTQREDRVAGLIELYRSRRVDWPLFNRLAFVFAGMFLAWMVFPPTVVPPEMPAITGLALGVVLTWRLRGFAPFGEFDLIPVFAIGSFLFIASLAQDAGLLERTAGFLQANVEDPRMLLLAVMGLTAVLTGLFSAGPTAAALLPVLMNLTGPGGALAGYGDQVAVAFAASICAGSSLFVWSATAGFVLMDKFKTAGLKDSEGAPLKSGIVPYLRLGVAHFLIQLSLAVAWALMFIPLGR